MSAEVPAPKSPVNRKNPFSAKIISRKRLTRNGFLKETTHLVIDIASSGITYQPGDALAVFPKNREERVDDLLARLDLLDSASTLVTLPGDEAGKTDSVPLREALISRLSLRNISKPLLELVQRAVKDVSEGQVLAKILEIADPAELKSRLDAHEVTDLFEEFPSIRLTPQELVTHLRKLMPRLYSISSSPRRDSSKINLTVAVVAYETSDRNREGICSNYLAHHAPLNESSVRVFVVPSHFKPPVDPKTPIIMVGPGAGIAPFRGFLQDRECQRQAGSEIGASWLFFGDWHKASDFLYEDEFLAWEKSGVLTKYSLAWSRDQQYPDKSKIYVQHKMREEGAEIWQWLNEKGAYFYVCGDAKYMAKDVNDALVEIVQKHGNMQMKEAQNYIENLRRPTDNQPVRYLRDVY